MLKVPGSEIAARIAALQAYLRKDGLDAAIIRQNADLFYFAGTVQDAHLMVPAVGHPLFLVRRDVGRAAEQSPLRPVLPQPKIRDLSVALAEVCRGSTPKRIGMELDVLPANAFFFYNEKVFPRQEIVDASTLVRRVRAVKSPWEIEMMRHAAACSKAVADAVPEILRAGITERELSVELERVARIAGHMGLIRLRGFNMDMYFGHVLSGPDAAMPSYGDMPTGGRGVSPAFAQGASDRKIQPGELVSVDTMLNRDGYLNDQTRNFCLGAPSSRLAEAYELSREVHGRFREAARPGTVSGELYDLVLKWVEEAGWADHFMGFGDTRVGFVGHGLGIEVDEYPFIARGQKLVLEEGMIVAFEPKFIVPGVGLAGLENTYAVTSGGLESLNTATEELVIV